MLVENINHSEVNFFRGPIDGKFQYILINLVGVWKKPSIKPESYKSVCRLVFCLEAAATETKIKPAIA